MAPWTIQERMLLHILFGHYKLDFYGQAWWAIYLDITKTSRTERTCREDYKYSHGKERTQMYPRRILKPYSQYDDEERAAYDNAFQDVIDSAKRLGITLPGSNGDENEEDEVDKGEDNTNEGQAAEDEDGAAEDQEIDNDGDAEMEDAEEDYATAQEGSSQMDDADQDSAAARDDEVDDDFQMEDEVTEKVSIWGQDGLEEAEFPATQSAMDVLSSAIGARKMSSEKPKVSATQTGSTFSLPPPLAPATQTRSTFFLPPPLFPAAQTRYTITLLPPLSTSWTSNPMTTTTSSTPNPIVQATPATGTPALPDTSGGEPQKRGRGRPKEQGLETESTPTAIDKGMKQGAHLMKKQLAAVGNVPDLLMGADLDEDLQEQTRGPHGEAAGKMLGNTAKAETPGAGSSQASKISKKPGATSKKPPRHQAKSATAGPRVPLALVTNKFQTALPVTVRSEKYDDWCRTNLDRLLFGEPFNMFPDPIKEPGKKRAPPEEPLFPDERVANFFIDMFDGKLTKKLILSIFKKEPSSDVPGRRLKKVYKFLLQKAEETSTGPRYRLSKVFESEKSPFSNFRLASAAFGQGLKMLHMSDVDYTGVGNQQLVAFAKTKNRHLTVDDIDFISPEDPVFKRGGRVHNIWIRQQECPILGESKKYNSAHICMDVMICQEAHCPKCSKDKDMGSEVKSITSLPRVHARHITPGDEFVAPLLMVSRKYEKDYKDEFIVDVNIGAQSIKLWDGTSQDVVVCDAGNCPGCCEDSGGIVDMARETRVKAETATMRWQEKTN